MGYWPVVINMMKNADIVLLVLDARMPNLSKNKEVERFANKFRKRLIYVYNKIDLISDESLAKLKEENPSAIFISAKERNGVDDLRKRLEEETNELKLEKPKIGFVGYPNVGKSALINALSGRRMTTVAANAGTTKGSQMIRVGNMMIIDSPGVIPFKDGEMALGVLGAKNPEKLKNTSKVAITIIDLFLDNNRKALEEYGGIDLSNKTKNDSYDILIEMGKNKKHLSKGGIVDENRISKQIVMDWQRGKLKI